MKKFAAVLVVVLSLALVGSALAAPAEKPGEIWREVHRAEDGAKFCVLHVRERERHGRSPTRLRLVWMGFPMGNPNKSVCPG